MDNIDDINDILRELAETQNSSKTEETKNTPTPVNPGIGDLSRSHNFQLESWMTLSNNYPIENDIQPLEWKDVRILIKIVSFDLDKRVASVTLDKYDTYGLEILKSYGPNVQTQWNNRNIRLFPWTEFNELLTTIGRSENNLDIEFTSEATKQYIELVTIPDLKVEFSRGYVRLIPARRFYFQGLQNIDTLRKNDDYHTWRLHKSEFYLFPIEFQKSYPKQWIEYSDEAFELLNQQVKRRELLNSLVNAEDAPEIPDHPFEPFNTDFKFRNYQKVAVKYAQELGMRNIIAYDMGLGKTAIAIRLIEQNNFRVLFVTKAKLKFNIQREIKKLTGKNSLVFSGTKPNQLDIELLIKNKQQYNIINYDVIGRPIQEKDIYGKVVHEIFPWAEAINFSQFDLIIYDEAQMMRNMDSQRSKGGRKMCAKHVLHLTGTPIVNRPSELFPLLNILDPESFSSFEAFIQSYTLEDGKIVRNPVKLKEILNQYMIRRKKEDVEKDLPPITRIDHYHELGDKARLLYQDLENGLYEALKHPDFKKRVDNILEKMLRMKQLTADDKVSSSVDLAREAWEETEHKVIIFSQFKESQVDIFKQLNEGGENNAILINGDTDSKRMYNLIDSFQSEDLNAPKYLVLSTLVGQEGLNLTKAHTVIFNDLMWTPAAHRQSEARAYGRLGDLHTINAYYVQAENTIDELIWQILQAKLNLIETIVDGAAAISGNDSILSELMDLMKKKRRI